MYWTPLCANKHKKRFGLQLYFNIRSLTTLLYFDILYRIILRTLSHFGILDKMIILGCGSFVVWFSQVM
jgi:hypothetical protein